MLCGDVSDDDLAGITGTLQVGGGHQGAVIITELKAGDFDGLTKLSILFLGSNKLRTLPAGVFDDLTALEALGLNSNQLQTFPDGVFDRLTALRKLHLDNNMGTDEDDKSYRLETLPAGLFDRLTALQELELQNNGLDQLPEGLFEHLTALTTLDLSENWLNHLPEGLFEYLAALTTLNLSNNRLKIGTLSGGEARLPDGIFEPLTALTSLDLSGQRNNPRIAPEAMAGPDDARVSIHGGEVTLDASGSGGPWGTNVTYAWALTDPTSGVTVTFDDATRLMPRVTIPPLASVDDELTFTLTVSALSAPIHTTTGIEDDTDTVTVTVNTPPTASHSSITTKEDEAYAFAAGDFNFVDDNAADTLASVTVVALPAAGKLTLDDVDVEVGQEVEADDIGLLEFTPAEHANGSPYTTFTFNVSDGMDESALTYTMTVNVTAVNDDATGKPTISGTAKVGRELTASTTGIDDADGLTDPTYGYQWIRVDDGTETPITDATSETYLLVEADAGKKIKVKVSFTDDGGTDEDLTSDVYPANATILGADGICERTAAVQAAILAAISGVNNCANVTQTQLAGISSLVLNGTLDDMGNPVGITALATGDFDGLSGLTLLNLSTNPLTGLPQGVFDPLTKLEDLILSQNGLTGLPEGVFDELTALKTLRSAHQQGLAWLPEGVFDSLEVLQYLHLHTQPDENAAGRGVRLADRAGDAESEQQQAEAEHAARQDL